MVFKPNYNFQKAERLKAKQSRKEEKAREKELRKTEGVPSAEPVPAGPDGLDTEVSGEQPDAA